MTSVVPMNDPAQSMDTHLQEPQQFPVYTAKDWDNITQLQVIAEDTRLQMQAVAQVLPFRVTQYVIDQLIDWNNIPADPIFQLSFPQPGMLQPKHLNQMVQLLKNNASQGEISALADRIRQRLTPHPAGGQQDDNAPELDGEKLESMQHKYRETLLFFPSQGQTCHSYCTFCFNWAQFIDDKGLRYANKEVEHLQRYLASNLEITDLLVTGGDPMVMKTHHLENYLEPLTSQRFDHIQSIRIGTKALSFWPQRFVTDSDADDLLRLLKKLISSGKHVAIMAHYNHWRELETDIARRAIRRILETGASIRSQGPLLANINDSANDWVTLWRKQVQLGIIPYYMFVERDTGARKHFEVPLAKAWEIYRDAIQQVSGLGRTARGPIMNAGPGKIEVQGVTEINGDKVFVLRMIQGRNPDWVQQPFFARYDEQATWISDLKPAFGETKFFFEDEYHQLCTSNPWRKQVS